MESRPYYINSAHEFRLRRHIREVLLPYARLHLTADHVAFTEAAVEELLLHNLEYVPMADATSFLLPTDPFEVLMRLLGALDLTPREEKWVTPTEYIRYVRDFFSLPPALQELRSERCWCDEDDHYERLSAMCKPLLTPILTRRSRLGAPKVGALNYQASIPFTEPALAAFLNLKPISITPVKEADAPSIGDVLDLHLKIDAATGRQVRRLVQSMLPSSTSRKIDDTSTDTPNVARFLNCVSPPRCHPGLESPPLFPCRRPNRSDFNTGSKTGAREQTSSTRVSDLAPMLAPSQPELIDDEDGDYDGHHMEVVSGWTTLTISSPPPPLVHSPDQSEVDELWDISSPRTPETSLVTAKMDEVEIPRVRKFGHKNTLSSGFITIGGAADLLMAAKSPGFFVTSFISAPVPMTPARKPTTFQLEVAKHSTQPPRPSSPDQTISNSLLGQPPTACGEQTNKEVNDTGSGPPDCAEKLELDAIVASLCASTPHDPLSCILEEKLDDKEIMLMDAPDLPPPTAPPKGTAYFPEGLRSFVAPKGEPSKLNPVIVGSNVIGPLAFLRPVKGIKPLTLDLSWRPFNFGKTIPTDEDVAGVVRPLRVDDEIPGYHEQKLREGASGLLHLVTSTTSSEEAHVATTSTFPRRCEVFGLSPTPKRDEERGHVEYVLTNRERAKASGGEIMSGTEVASIEDPEPDLATESRLRNDKPEYPRDLGMREEQTSRSSLDQMSRAYESTTVDNLFFDDSGIDIAEMRFVTSEFGSPVLSPEPGNKIDIRRALYELEANKENIDPRGENKENLSAWDAEDHENPRLPSQSLGTQYDWTEYIEYPESVTPPFEPLSFPSQSQVLGPNDLEDSMAQVSSDQPPSTGHVKRTVDDLVSTNKPETSSKAIKRRKLNDLVPTSSRDLFAAFIGLRNHVLPPSTETRCEIPVDEVPTVHQTITVSEEILPRVTPNDVFDQRTVRLPEHWIPAAMVHRYLASMALIQKRALVRELQEEPRRVLLVERHDLGGMDIIIDPDHAILFVPLLALPANLEQVVERISCESWRYLNIFVVFEAYPGTHSFNANPLQGTRLMVYAYTPPICKAIKKLRRNLGIAGGLGTMDPRCTITWAFANDVGEAASFVRLFGEEARVKAIEIGNGIIWDEREWLEEDEREGESDLSGVHGMNVFAAFIMLYNNSLETILDLPLEVRLADFGQLVGQDRVVGLNTVIERRLQLLEADNMDSIVDAGD